MVEPTIKRDNGVFNPRTPEKRSWFYAGFFLVYLAAELLGYLTFYGVESTSIIWPAAGVYGATLVVTARRHWPVIILTMVIVNQGMFLVMRDAFPGIEGLVLMGLRLFYNPLVGIVFALVVRGLVKGCDPLAGPRALLIYVAGAIMLNMVTASLIIWTIAAIILVDPAMIGRWQQWSYSGISGMLAIGTPIIVIVNRWGHLTLLKERRLELLLFLLVFMGVNLFMFASPLDLGWLEPYEIMILLPLFAWVIGRFGPVMLTVTASSAVLIVIIGMRLGLGPFHVPDRPTTLNVLYAQGVLVPGIITLLFISAMLEGQRRQYERQLRNEKSMRRLDRIQTLGTMAGGVAHDFGNLAIAIRAYISIFRSQLKDPPAPVRQAIQGLDEVADGAQSLTRSLMIFARDEANHDIDREARVSDLCEAVTECFRVMEQLLGARHELVVANSPEALYVGASSGDLQRMLSNLIINARDASPEGSRIELTVEKADNRARLSVRDEGSGIPAEIRGRVFDPFFTTKARGKGTGLGLAIVSGIVREMGAEISIDSREQKGTTIRITMPLVDPPEDE